MLNYNWLWFGLWYFWLFNVCGLDYKGASFHILIVQIYYEILALMRWVQAQFAIRNWFRLAKEVGLAADVLVEGLEGHILIRLQLPTNIAQHKLFIEFCIFTSILRRFCAVELLTLLKCDERILLSKNIRVLKESGRDHIDFQLTRLFHDGG